MPNVVTPFFRQTPVRTEPYDHHLIACGRGTPLAFALTCGNRNDITQLIPLVDAIPPVRGRCGRPRRRPRSLYGDRAYHSRESRGELRRRPYPGEDRLAQERARLAARDEAVGRRAHDLLATPVPRLRIRYERRDDIHEALLAIGCSLICLKLHEAGHSF